MPPLLLMNKTGGKASTSLNKTDSQVLTSPVIIKPFFLVAGGNYGKGPSMVRMLVGFLFAAILLTLGCCAMSQPETNKAEPETQKGESGKPPGPAAPMPFDARRALKYLEEICLIGPRISGSEGMIKQQQFLKKHFEKLGGRVRFQEFTARQVSRRTPVAMANLIVTWFPERPRRVILCCHYDTRPIADQEEDRRKWTEPFVSANDGGSGVALLMELAHHLKDLKTAVGVDFVFFDGEEYIFNPSGENRDQYFFGSEHFADVYRKDRNRPRYLGAVLLDMIAGPKARFPAEAHSVTQAGGLVREIWQVAADLRCPAFRQEVGAEIEDDHLALNRAGIPAVDIIDLGPDGINYPHWHRLSDLPENCSSDTLAQVAQVLIVWLQGLK
jgi:hypothetical protein